MKTVAFIFGTRPEAIKLAPVILAMKGHRDLGNERPEMVMAQGIARLAGTDSGRIVAEASRLLMDAQARRQMARSINPNSNGKARERIIGTCATLCRGRSSDTS